MAIDRRPDLKALSAIWALCILLNSPAAADNQLYTGDASTVPPHKMQYQLVQDSTPSRHYRFAGTSLTYGASTNSEVRLAIGHLWSNFSPDARVGPNAGAKWRFIGDGRREPSMAVSALVSQTDISGGGPFKPDYGALLIGSYPSRYVTFLGNFGRVWVGESRPDLYYLSFAATRRANIRTLVALQYSNLRRIGSVPAKNADTQYTAGIVYSPDRRVSYSLQVGYLPLNPRFHFRTTLSFSLTF